MIKASALAWTIVRPGLLTSGPATGRARAWPIRGLGPRLHQPRRCGGLYRARGVRAALRRPHPAADPMSRWASDPDAAADQLIIRCLDDIDVAGRVLLANQTGGVAPR